MGVTYKALKCSSLTVTRAFLYVQYVRVCSLSVTLIVRKRFSPSCTVFTTSYCHVTDVMNNINDEMSYSLLLSLFLGLLLQV